MKKIYAVYIVLMLSMFCAGSSLNQSQSGFWEVFTVSLFVAALIIVGCRDMKSMKIEDKWNAILLGIGMLSCVVRPELSFTSRIIGIGCVSIPFLVIALLIPGSFGGGDIKLSAVCGLFLGWKAMLVSAAAGIFLGGIWMGCLMVTGRIGRKEDFPLGPFLCLGMAFGIYAGDPAADVFFGL